MKTRCGKSRIHGRGGQGVVTAAELLAMAAFMDGNMPRPFRASGRNGWEHWLWRSAASLREPSARAKR